MKMRRLFIIRKDLGLSPGKLAAMIGHCCEAYWTRMISRHIVRVNENILPCTSGDIRERVLNNEERKFQWYRRSDLNELSLKAFNEGKDYFLYDTDENGHCIDTNEMKYHYEFVGNMDKSILEDYVRASFVKTICEAKNLNHLMKVVDKAKEIGLKEDEDYGVIRDNCYTELQPENEDGTCTVGIWFKPLDDDIAHELSKKYQLYKG